MHHAKYWDCVEIVERSSLTIFVNDCSKRTEKVENMKTVAIPTIIGELGTIPKTLPKGLKDIGIKTKIGEMQNTVTLNT